LELPKPLSARVILLPGSLDRACIAQTVNPFVNHRQSDRAQSPVLFFACVLPDPKNTSKPHVWTTNLIQTKIISAFLQTKLVKISPASCQNCIKICVLPGHGFDNLLLA